MRRCGIVLWLCLLLVVPALAKEPADALRTQLQEFVHKGELAGVVTFVGDKDGVIDVQVLGHADLEHRLPMRRDSLFRIASMTKPITALAVMQLVEAGKLSIDDPVEKHLPEFKGQMLAAARDNDTVTLKKPARPITVKDLLTHTSGLPVYPAGLAEVYTKRNWTLRDTTIAISQAPLMFEPGSKWSYCNPGIDVLGRIIEVLSGLSYDQYLRAHLFHPLGMHDTTPYPNQGQLKRLAMTYGKQNGKLVPTPAGVLDLDWSPKHPVPAGGLFSTGDDLARLYQCLLNGGTLNGRQILASATLAEMTRNQVGELKNGFYDGSQWGLGFGLVGTPTGVTEKLSAGTYGHGGAYGTQAWIDPQQGKYSILLIQRTGLSTSDGSAIRKVLNDSASAVRR